MCARLDIWYSTLHTLDASRRRKRKALIIFYYTFFSFLLCYSVWYMLIYHVDYTTNYEIRANGIRIKILIWDLELERSIGGMVMAKVNVLFYHIPKWLLSIRVSVVCPHASINFILFQQISFSRNNNINNNIEAQILKTSCSYILLVNTVNKCHTIKLIKMKRKIKQIKK